MAILSDLTPSILRDLYLTQHLTESEIADRYGTYQVQVSRLRRKWGIPTITKAQRLSSLLPPLTDQQHQLLIGGLLGDGSMGATGPGTARYQEGHSLEQLGYLEWKQKILGPYISSSFDTRKVGFDGREFFGRTFVTKGCQALRPYYDSFYPPPHRKRVFPRSLFRDITPLVLAVWYMDDGRISGFHPEISFGLDAKSLKRAIKALRRLGLKPGLRGDLGSDMMISFPGQSDAFFSLVAPHMPPCMGYKLPSTSLRRELDRNAKRLTPELASELYSGGMSLQEIATTYRVGATTVKRRLQDLGVQPRQMGRVRKSYSLTAAEISLGNYDPKQWGSLGEAEQDRWVDDIYKVLANTPFPFPTPSEDRSQYELDRLGRLTTRLVEDRIEPWSPVGCGLCGQFFPNRYKASAGRWESAFEAWHKEDKLRYAIRFQLRQGDPVTPHRVLRAVTMGHRTPSVFRPSVARFIYQTYCPPGGTVWDPCSGYGGRLLGAYLAGVNYVGTDVEGETIAGNERLAEYLGYKPSLHCCPAESFSPPPVDLVFTSPPYFDRERYSTGENQSWVRHGTSVDSWLEGFLRPVVVSSYKVLPKGGHLILNIADLRVNGKLVTPLVPLTTGVAQGEGFDLVATHQMPLARLNRAEASEPILVFKRL